MFATVEHERRNGAAVLRSTKKARRKKSPMKIEPGRQEDRDHDPSRVQHLSVAGGTKSWWLVWKILPKAGVLVRVLVVDRGATRPNQTWWYIRFIRVVAESLTTPGRRQFQF